MWKQELHKEERWNSNVRVESRNLNRYHSSVSFAPAIIRFPILKLDLHKDLP